MEDRLEELETQIAFQNNTLQELNDAIIHQQQQIDQLDASVKLIIDKMRSLATDTVKPESEETPPPHY